MSQLERLYHAIDELISSGVDIDDDFRKKLDHAEEEIINKSVIPVLKKEIEPVIGQIRRDLILLVEYSPDRPLDVRITRKKVIVSETPGETEPLKTYKPKLGHHNPRPRSTVGPRTGLEVIFPDGRIINERYAKETMAAAIKNIGYQRVQKLGMSWCKVPLVANYLDEVYSKAQIEIAPRVYVMTHSSTAAKKNLLDRISKTLNLGLRVNIVY